MRLPFDKGDLLQGAKRFFSDLSCADRNDARSNLLGPICHRLSNNIANPFCRFDQMVVGNMGVARGGPVPLVTEQLAH